MKKIRPITNTWYDSLINYIPEPIRKSLGGFKDKIVSLFKRNTTKKNRVWDRKNLSKPNMQNKINNPRNPFILKKKKKNRIKDRLIKDTWTHFETEEK